MLSSRYRFVDNLDVLLAVLDGIRSTGAEVQVGRCDLTERRMYMQISSPAVAAHSQQLLTGYVLLDGHQPFTDLAAAQAAVDAWQADYNTARPHQSLEMATPATRFTPAASAGLVTRLVTRCSGPGSGWRWRSTVWCRHRGTWRCAGSSSGSAPTGPAPRSRSGPTPPWSTCSLAVTGSRPHRRGCRSLTCSGWCPTAGARPVRRRCPPRSTSAPAPLTAA